MEGHEALAAMLRARSVAVVGASTDPDKWGHHTIKTILAGGYDGRLVGVNPKATAVLGVPCYPSVSAIPGDVDLVLIVIPAQHVPQVLAESAARGVKVVALTSAGYRESGFPEREEALVRQVRDLGLRLLGPNIQGFVYTPNRLSAMFWPHVRLQGPIGLISSSGSLTAAFAEWAVADGVGVSGMINLGNRVDLDECDMLQFYAHDPYTRVIALYLEGLRNGRQFLETARAVARIKPVVMLKSGRSTAGQRSAASHTGSLAGMDAVLDAACRQYGLLRVDDLEMLLDASKALAAARRPRGRRVLVVTTSGGGATLACDEAEKRGLEIPPLPPAMIEELRGLDLHHNATLSNPLDLAGVTVAHFDQALAVADRYDVADTYLIVFADPVPGSTECARQVAGRTSRAVAVAYLAGGETECISRPEIQAAGIPVFRAPERASRGIAAAVAYHESTQCGR